MKQFRWDYWLNAKTSRSSNPKSTTSGHGPEHAEALRMNVTKAPEAEVPEVVPETNPPELKLNVGEYDETLTTPTGTPYYA